LLEIWSISNKNLTEDMLKRSFNLAISDLLLMNNFRGSRHAKKLPCRGQRTKTNSRNSRKMRRKI
jgi:small subunit ribosomal protein S13